MRQSAPEPMARAAAVSVDPVCRSEGDDADDLLVPVGASREI